MDTQVWTPLQHVNEWIRFADGKATALLAASGVLGGLLAGTHPIGAVHRPADVLALGAFVIAMAAVTTCAGVSLLSLQPRVRRRLATPSLLYFGDVMRQFAESPERFSAAFLALAADNVALGREIARQVWTNSAIASVKFRLVSVATWSIGVALLAAGVEAVARHS
ncbi:Pycsar system effector family protein [Dactylosporangium sp. NPDC051485]|uniref:Pycsar system effector family protein n=1 Tax=Dactylosporangium sp. NPDC051485 TaxID=3154846 RepID=UPI0034386574